ncbi:ATP-dependent DNA helicase chl1 [Batrachochytrium dendrobatidis]|nr:ATP-dependent DNA helicase chl1 [Batrachochytrium dendrobatidis]
MSATPSKPIEQEFPFPYQPWDIQTKFMQSLYKTLDNNHVGIYESPTGTGKSLSIICSALKWLKDRQTVTINDLLAEQDDQHLLDKSIKDEPDWVIAHDRERRRNEIADMIEKQKHAREQREIRLQQIRNRESIESTRSTFKRKAESNLSDLGLQEKENFLVEEYDSDENSPSSNSLNQPWSLQYTEKEEDLNKDLDEIFEIQIIYCARTHSQIAQFVNEIKKTAYGNIKCVTLGSRKNLCINQSVTRLQSLHRINDKCLDLQKAKTSADKSSKSSGGCPYLTEDPVQMVTFDDTIHARIRDIEEIVQAGRKSATCPYYGARHTAKSSEIICIPYNLLLQRSTRESIGLRLKNNIIILDEAHNIIESVNSLYSHTISLDQILDCKTHLSKYFERYKNRLAGRNMVYVKQLLVLLGAFEQLFAKLSPTKFDHALHCKSQDTPYSAAKSTQESNHAMSVSEFVDKAGIDHFNLFKILTYLENSRLPFKLLGFAVSETRKENSETANFIPTSVSPLSFMQSFLASLTDPDVNGRIVYNYSTDPHHCVFKYLLLNPADCFAPILKQARSVVFTGGTMSPIHDFIEQLLPFVQHDRLDVFSCGHVINSTSLLPICVSQGPTGLDFNFSHEKRVDTNMMDEAGAAIANYSNVISGGIVVFFVSYSYLDAIVKQWKSGGIWTRISKKKKIFIEPTSVGEVDKVLQDYSSTINRSRQTDFSTSTLTGSMLLAVVSGKLSEGINFADDMGRAVIMVGIPFANIASIELQERMRFFDVQAKETGSGITGKEYYENICMRAVNQSVGRAIRHKNDYAVIIFLDMRFKRDRIVAKLPEWIRNCGLTFPNQFGPSIAMISKFFNSHRKPTNKKE